MRWLQLHGARQQPFRGWTVPVEPKRFRVESRGVRVELLLDVLNALDDAAAEGIATDTLTTSTVAQAPGFGVGNVFIDPRRAMVGVTFEGTQSNICCGGSRTIADNTRMSDDFSGFPREAFMFWSKLERNNNREWFQANKEVYERACRQPLQALVDELKPLYGGGKISRINRDMRFARDRSPYKNYIAAGVGSSYLSLTKEGLWVGTGMYKPDPATLARFRAAVGEEESGRELMQLVRRLRRQRYDVSTHESLRSAPKGFDDDHPRLELLRMKDIYAGKLLAPAALASPTALGGVTRAMRDTAPLAAWLRSHVLARRPAGGSVEGQ
jgi:uncharacterized protein (TIGR02453 family)